MEKQFGNALDGVAGVVAKKWYAVMGLVGLIAFVTSLFVELPTDRTVTTCIALILMGWGFGQTECRTFRMQVGHGWRIKGPAWRLTVTGFIMFAIAFGATAVLIRYLWI